MDSLLLIKTTNSPHALADASKKKKKRKEKSLNHSTQRAPAVGKSFNTKLFKLTSKRCSTQLTRTYLHLQSMMQM